VSSLYTGQKYLDGVGGGAHRFFVDDDGGTLALLVEVLLYGDVNTFLGDVYPRQSAVYLVIDLELQVHLLGDAAYYAGYYLPLVPTVAPLLKD